MKTKDPIKELIDNSTLPSLPEALIRLNGLISTGASMKEIGETISSDPSLLIRTLELANSAWYKRQKKIADVNDAIAMIGLSTLYQVVFASSIARSFQNIDNTLVNMNTFWSQSLRMATSAESISERIGESVSLLRFSGGLLCYIGKLILYTAAPAKAQTILEKSRKQAIPQYQIETEVLGFNHAEISAELMRTWELPSSIHIPIEHYINPEDAPVDAQIGASILHTSHFMQFTYANDIPLTDTPTPIEQKTLNRLNINEPEIPQLSRIANESYKRISSMLRVGVPPEN